MIEDPTTLWWGIYISIRLL